MQPPESSIMEVSELLTHLVDAVQAIPPTGEEEA
jgi:hypothetical protein